jgi:hypothetical protein
MLTVVPASINLATQKILELTTEANIYSDCTLSVLTKLNLVNCGAESSVVDLVESCAYLIKLG